MDEFSDFKLSPEQKLKLLEPAVQYFLSIGQNCLEKIINLADSSPNPRRALLSLSRYIEFSPSPMTTSRFICDEEAGLDAFLHITGASDFLAEIIAVHTPYFDQFITSNLGKTRTVEEHLSELAPLFSALPYSAFMNELRRYRLRETLRIAGNDILGIADVRTSTFDFSNLADAVLEMVLKAELERAKKRFGEPETEIAVVSLGKHGGQELNYSSDIDIFFVYGKDGETTEGMKHSEFFERVARSVIGSLTKHTPEGMLFRVDTRLAPDGGQMRIALPLSAFKNYYFTRGNAWEKQALVKARVSAGSRKIGEEFIKIAEEFSFGTYPTPDEISEIITIKSKLELNVTSRDIKKGTGGIRDIEFTVQLLQLLYGWNVPELRVKSTFEAIEKLGKAGIITSSEAETLYENYSFLRKVENMIQISENRQVFEIPENRQKLETLARTLGFTGSEAVKSFTDKLNKCTKDVRELHTKFFKRIFGIEKITPEVEFLINPESNEKVSELLRKRGFKNPKAVLEVLRELSSYSIRTPTILSGLVKKLLDEAEKTSSPDDLLLNFSDIIHSYGAESYLLESMVKNEGFFDLLIKILRFSPFTAEKIKSNPSFLDLLTEPLFMRLPTSHDLLEEMLELKRDAFMDFEKSIVEVYKTESFRILVRELAGEIDFVSSVEARSILTDFVLSQVFSEFFKSESFKGDVVLFAFGKLAERMFDIGSDADVLVIFGDERDRTAVEKAFSRFLDFFSKNKRETFEVDVRLRPSGTGGSFAVHISAFKRTAEPWERVAFSRARPVSFTGSDSFPSNAQKVIWSFCFSNCPPDEVASGLAHIRKRMIKSFKKKRLFNIKKDFGGLSDVEFTTVFLMCLKRPSKPLSSITEMLKEVDEENFREVQESVMNLKQMDHKLRIFYGTSKPIPISRKQFADLIHMLGIDDWKAEMKKFIRSVKTIRKWSYEKMFSKGEENG